MELYAASRDSSSSPGGVRGARCRVDLYASKEQILWPDPPFLRLPASRSWCSRSVVDRGDLLLPKLAQLLSSPFALSTDVRQECHASPRTCYA